MEDAYTAVPFLLEVPMPSVGSPLEDLVPPRIATHVRGAGSIDAVDSGDDEMDAATASAAGATVAATTAATTTAPPSTLPGAQPAPLEMDALHFFGVFDGHGGAEAALHCARTLHERIAEALGRNAQPPATAGVLPFESASATTLVRATSQAVAATALATVLVADGPAVRLASEKQGLAPPALDTANAVPAGAGAVAESGSEFIDADMLDAHVHAAVV